MRCLKAPGLHPREAWRGGSGRSPVEAIDEISLLDDTRGRLREVSRGAFSGELTVISAALTDAADLRDLPVPVEPVREAHRTLTHLGARIFSAGRNRHRAGNSQERFAQHVQRDPAARGERRVGSISAPRHQSLSV